MTLITEQAPLKRTRTRSPEIELLSIRAPGLWFDDGSIILAAKSPAHDPSCKRYVFKVHRSTLRAHSQVFADMLTASCPDGGEIIEGCPVVDLPDDADDICCLLKALYDPTYALL